MPAVRGIGENHLIRWDDKPYVPYGFTGNGDVNQMMRLGFNQFHVGPAEQLWAAWDDPARRQEAVQQVNELAERLTARGATYYASYPLATRRSAFRGRFRPKTG